MSSQLFNSPRTLVQESIEGLVRAHDHLQRLDGFPAIKVVTRRDWDKAKVALISGGGSGHEPAHAGFVGRGMLTAAVCGDVFASPPADAVLAAIRAVTGPSGALLIVKNYTGDRLNFGLAAEMAKAEGYAVETVCVADDGTLFNSSVRDTGARGIAGAVFVHKIAGALAEEGHTLTTVLRGAEDAAKRASTVGLGLTICSLPGGAPTRVSECRLPPGMMEIGLGIHGEPGSEQRPTCSLDEAVQLLVDTATSPAGRLSLSKGSSVALLVNNLGSTSNLVLPACARAAVLHARKRGFSIERVGVGSFMTSLDMSGVSVTVLDLPPDGSLTRLLDAETDAPAWPRSLATDVEDRVVPVPPSPGLNRGDEDGTAGNGAGWMVDAPVLGRCLRGACAAVREARLTLDDYDRITGDGDCGATLAEGARCVEKAIESWLPAGGEVDLRFALRKVAAALSGMGGTSGAVYRIGLNAAAVALAPGRGLVHGGVAGAVAAAGRAALASLEKHSGARRNCRTMVDALGPAIDALDQTSQKGAEGAACAACAADAAEAGARATRGMRARLGRASYITSVDALSSAPDPGAAAVAAWVRGIANALAPDGGV
ncbi:unnamed protein product [Pedinophyceae sp. YPF-701]|nr:unnamed protein product [Pedinophyceae sp. YPF-701]